MRALARAHTLLAQGRWEGVGLQELVRGEMAPFLSGHAVGAPGEGGGPRIEMEGPAVTLGPTAAQAVSMALHELATNATKHGALLAPGGGVSASWSVDREAGLLRLRWAESGGPRIEAPPPRRGFGSRVLEATIRDQLGGQLQRVWRPEGLLCSIDLPMIHAVAEHGGVKASAAD